VQKLAELFEYIDRLERELREKEDEVASLQTVVSNLLVSKSNCELLVRDLQFQARRGRTVSSLPRPEAKARISNTPRIRYKEEQPSIYLYGDEPEADKYHRMSHIMTL
jgi:hypothetical protein